MSNTNHQQSGDEIPVSANADGSRNWDEPVKLRYRNQQDTATNKLQELMKPALSDKNDLAYCLRLFRIILNFHIKGTLKIHTVKSNAKVPRATYITEMNLKCSERREKVIEAVKSNKLVAIDIIKSDTDKMMDLARVPENCLRRKFTNTACNNKKAETTSEGRRVEAGEKAAELAALQQESKEPDASDESSYEEAPEETLEQLTTTGKRVSKARSEETSQPGLKTPRRSRAPKRTIAETADDDENSNQAEQDASKRSKVTPLSATRVARGPGPTRGKNRKRPSNFPSEAQGVPVAKAQVLESSRSSPPQAIEGAAEHTAKTMSDVGEGAPQRQPSQFGIADIMNDDGSFNFNGMVW